MYCKRFLTALTAAFVLFVLTGCKYGTITSVNEEDYFPRFEVKADNVSYLVHKRYDSVEEQDKEFNVFEGKGDYYMYNFIGNYYTMRDDPLGDGRIKRAGMIQGGGSVIFNSIIVDTNDNITRDNKLFEEIFGYKSGELTSVSVTKYFSDKSVIDYFETYGKLLEQQGFKEVRSEFWRKIDYKNGIIYSWSYTVEGDGKSPLMSASWEYEPYNLYSAINTLTQR